MTTTNTQSRLQTGARESLSAVTPPRQFESPGAGYRSDLELSDQSAAVTGRYKPEREPGRVEAQAMQHPPPAPRHAAITDRRYFVPSGPGQSVRAELLLVIGPTLLVIGPSQKPSSDQKRRPAETGSSAVSVCLAKAAGC